MELLDKIWISQIEITEKPRYFLYIIKPVTSYFATSILLQATPGSELPQYTRFYVP